MAVHDFPFPTERVFSGAHGRLIDANGRMIQETAEFTASIEPQYKEIVLAGTRWIGQKLAGVKGVGSMKLLRISADLRTQIAQSTTSGTPFVTQLIGEVGNDESAVERWLFMNVKFTGKVDLVKFSRQDEVEDELEFSFVGCQRLA